MLMLLGAAIPAATSSSTPRPDQLVTLETSQISLSALKIIDNSWSPLNRGAGAGAGYISSSGDSVVIDFGKRLAEVNKEPKWQIKFGRNQTVQVGSASDPVFWIYNSSDSRIMAKVSEARGLPQGVTLELCADGILISRLIGTMSNPDVIEAADSIVPGTYSVPANGSVPVYVLVNTDGSVSAGIWEANLRLGFTIPSYQDGDDAAPVPTTATVDIIGLSSTTSLKVDNNGIAQETVQLTSLDGTASITIAKETKLLNAQGKPLDLLSATTVNSPPSAPTWAAIISAYSFGPEGAAFSPPITLTLSYDPEALPEGVAEEDLVIAYYDEEASEWVELDCVVDTENNTITASVAHFTTFAIIGTVTPPAPAPAAFSVSSLSVLPAEVEPGETVTIAVSVANTGGEAGSYQVTLVINDLVEATKEVTVRAGLSKEVTFSVTKEEAGTYTVAVDGLSGSFTVVPVVVPPAPPGINWPLIGGIIGVVPPAPPGINWPLIGGIIGGVIVVGLIIFFLKFRRRLGVAIRGIGSKQGK